MHDLMDDVFARPIERAKAIGAVAKGQKAE